MVCGKIFHCFHRPRGREGWVEKKKFLWGWWCTREEVKDAILKHALGKAVNQRACLQKRYQNMVSDFLWPSQWMMSGLMSAQSKAIASPAWREQAVMSEGLKPTEGPTMAPVAMCRASVMSWERTPCC